MTDYEKALANARDALAIYRRYGAPHYGEPLCGYATNAIDALDDLLAALDAARGEAVAVVNRHMLETLVPNRWIPVVAPSEERSDTDVLLFAAPPAAAVPAGKDWQAEAMKHAQSALYWRDRCEMLEDPVRKAQQPAAAVPAEPVAWVWQGNIDGLKAGNRFEKALLWNRPTGQAGFALYAAPPAALAVPADDAIEAAYWDFDARHKGYGPHKITPQSERDAFKWAVRAMLAAANKENSNG